MKVIQIRKLLVCQQRVRNPEQIPSIADSIKEGAFVPPVFVSEMEDGLFRIEDGVHRSTAYLLSGEFEIVPFNGSRSTTGTLIDLIDKYGVTSEGMASIYGSL